MYPSVFVSFNIVLLDMSGLVLFFFTQILPAISRGRLPPISTLRADHVDAVALINLRKNDVLFFYLVRNLGR